MASGSNAPFSGDHADLSNVSSGQHHTPSKNAPSWTEDGNSPLKINNSSSGTYTLKSQYKAVKLVVIDKGSREMDLRVNGDSSANYNYRAANATSVSGASQFGFAVTRESGIGQVMDLAGDWTNSFSAHFGSQTQFGGQSAISGVNTNVTPPLDSFTFIEPNSNSTNLTVRVFGLK